jgi:hypothetical protein
VLIDRKADTVREATKVAICGAGLVLVAATAKAWEFDKAYPLPTLPVLAQPGSADTVFAFASEKTGYPKIYARTSVPLRLSGFGCLARDPDDATGSTFWTLDDRGLSEPYESGSTSARVFALPDYHQKLVKWRLEDGALKALEIDSIASLESASVYTVGLPSSKVDGEDPAWRGRLDTALVDPSAVLAPVPHGYDFEALRIAPSGNFLVSDELGPFLLEIDKATKRIAKEWYPGKGLPKVFAKRRDNRGFEAMAVTPSGKVLAMLQSPADNWANGDSKDSRMLRILRFDPATETSSEYVYLLDLKGTSARLGSETKIGDVVALSETRFLAIEHGADGSGKYCIDLVEFDIAQATDIHDPEDKAKGRTYAVGSSVMTPEQIGMDTSTAVWASAGIVPVTKSVRLADLLSAGTAWTSEKPEGLEILGDSAVALLNDDDYGAQDKNSDGIPHLLADAELGESLVYLGLPEGTGVQSARSRAVPLRTERIGASLRVVAPGAGEGTLRILDPHGRILSTGVLRGGVGTVSLDGVAGGIGILELESVAGRASRLVQVVR